jgi:peptide/nickel transport system permease protein
MIPALLIANLLATLLAVTAARRAGTLYDAAIAALGLAGYSAPVFWLGQLLIIVFAVTFGLLPAQGMQSPVPPQDLVGQTVDVLRHSLMPLFCLVIYYMATVATVGRASILESLGQDFVLTARAKGLSMRRVMWTHVLPSALGPIIAVVGYQFGHALTGALLTEVVFAWPGLGSLFVRAIAARDYPVIQGIFLLSGIVVVLGNLASDVIHATVDPRVRVSVTTDG